MARDDHARTVAHRFGGVNLRTQAVEDRKAQGAVGRPLRVANADHELRPHTVHRLGHYRLRGKRPRVRGELLERVADGLRRLVVVAAADSAAWEEAAVLEITHQERAEQLLTGPANDHEIVRLDRLDLEPEGTALAGHVWTLLVLGDHAF